MTILELTSRHRSELRAQAHSLNPVVLIGDKGLTDAVLKEIDRSLTAHELIKVRAGGEEREDREAILTQICEQLNAAPVHHLGKIFILYRPRPDEEPAEAAPGSRKPGPRDVQVTIPSRTGKRPPQRKVVRVMGNERVTAGGLVKKGKTRQASVKKRGG
jgi:RNA-binding protein